MSDIESALAAHLNGKFFWEHTETLDEGSVPPEVMSIRRAQRKFSEGAKNVTERNKRLGDLKTSRPGRVNLREDQEVLAPLAKAICEVYGVSCKELFGRGKTGNLPKARKHFYWAIFRYFPSISLSQAGRMVGRDHSSILHSKNSFDKEYNVEMVGVVDQIMGWDK